MSNCYFECLSSVITQVGLEMAERHAVPATPSWSETICEGGHIPYGTTNSFHFELAALNDKPTRKYFHVVIARLDTGSYELNCYVL